MVKSCQILMDEFQILLGQAKNTSNLLCCIKTWKRCLSQIVQTLTFGINDVEGIGEVIKTKCVLNRFHKL